jgi:hypothetical protein
MISIKKTSLWLCLSGLGILVSTAPAFAWGSPSEVDVGFHVNCMHGGVQAHLGPWFSYFPYDAYFQMPAPIAPYPNWPMPFPPRPVMPPATGYQMPPMAAPPVQPVGYGYQMPAYWYGYGYGGYSGR